MKDLEKEKSRLKKAIAELTLGQTDPVGSRGGKLLVKFHSGPGGGGWRQGNAAHLLVQRFG
jgi:hypothetical protein